MEHVMMLFSKTRGSTFASRAETLSIRIDSLGIPLLEVNGDVAARDCSQITTLA
jgi:hypothetical protein